MDRGGLLAHVTRARARGVLWQHSDSAALGCDFRDGGRDQRVLAGLMRAGRALCQQWPGMRAAGAAGCTGTPLTVHAAC